MQQKLPRALAAGYQQALGAEQPQAGAVVHEGDASPALTAVLVTRTRLIWVAKRATLQWPLASVAVAEYQRQTPGSPAALSLLADEEVLRLRVPDREPAADLHEVFTEIGRAQSPTRAARAMGLPWWERKAAWPPNAVGHIAGGNTSLVPGQSGSLTLSLRGIEVLLRITKDPAVSIIEIQQV